MSDQPVATREAPGVYSPRMADNVPLPATERDLLDISLRGHPDPFLADLLDLATHGTEIAVGLLVNGMIVLGRLDRSETMAAALSTMRRRLIDRSPKPEGQSEEQWEAVREGFAEAPNQYIAGLSQATEQTLAELGEYAVEGQVDLDSLPAGLARRVREVGVKAHITLSDARVAAAGQDGMTALPVMRVAVQSVTGWWFAMPEEDGTSNIELWGAGRSEG
jgi:hypothetical protein